jgi:3-phenylpropionate/trans-cinnamate dioxygenase ferredoxin subunit
MIVDVGAVDEFAPDTVRVFDVNGREVCVVQSGGEWYGLRNICPHQTETLALGTVRPEIKPGARFGQVRTTDRMLLTCPRHCWAFDLRTGQCVVDPNLRVRAYAVSTEAGRVLVDDGRPEKPTAKRAEPAHETADQTA